MKYSKNILIIIFLFAVAATALFAFGGEIFAQTYSPLSPLPGDGGAINTIDPGSYFARMFAIFVGVAAVIAVIMLVICGFQYMTSDAIGSKESAKKRCWAAILGLGLILISWLILNTINPNLLNLPFDSLRDTLKQGVINPETGGGSTGGGSTGGGSTGGGSTPPAPASCGSIPASICLTSCVSNSCHIDPGNKALCLNSGCNVIETVPGSTICDCSGAPPPLPPTPLPWCYVSSSGLTSASYLDKASCNAARDVEIAPLVEKLTNLETNGGCYQLFISSTGPYFFNDKLGGSIDGGPFCGPGNPIDPSTTGGSPTAIRCVDDVIVFGASLHCAGTLTNRIIQVGNEISNTSQCDSNPSCK